MITRFKRVIVVTRDGCAIVTQMALPRVSIPEGWIREVQQFVLDPLEDEWRYDVLCVDAWGTESQASATTPVQHPEAGREALEQRLATYELTPIHYTQSANMFLRLPHTVPARYV